MWYPKSFQIQGSPIHPVQVKNYNPPPYPPKISYPTSDNSSNSPNSCIVLLKTVVSSYPLPRSSHPHQIKPLRMEQIPSPITQPQKLLLLLPHTLLTISPLPESPTGATHHPPRSSRSNTKRRTPTFLILLPPPPPPLSPHRTPRQRTGRRRRLMTAIMHDLRNQLRSPPRQLRLRFLSRAVFARARGMQLLGGLLRGAGR